MSSRSNNKSPKLPPTPGFQRIADDIRRQVRQGQLEMGTLLPGQRALAAEYGVSTGTMQQAVAQLLADGTLRTEGGRGTFVAAMPSSGVTEVLGRTGEGAREDRPRALPISLGIIAHMTQGGDGNSVYNAWQQKVVHTLEWTMSEEGETQQHFLNLASPDGISLPLADGISSLLAEGVDALAVVAPTWSLSDAQVEDVYATLTAQRVPIVLISHQDLVRPVLNVYYDSRSAGYQAAHHLIRQGYRRLAYVAPVLAGWVEQRLAGVRDAVRLAGLSADALAFFPEGDRIPALPGVDFVALGYETARALPPGALESCGVIAANDEIAYGILDAARAAGLEAGSDYGLVGFDDAAGSRVVGLTSLHPPLEAMGREAGRLLLQALHGDDTPVMTQLRLRSHLIARASSRPVPASLIAKQGAALQRR